MSSSELYDLELSVSCVVTTTAVSIYYSSTVLSQQGQTKTLLDITGGSNSSVRKRFKLYLLPVVGSSISNIKSISDGEYILSPLCCFRNVM